MDVCKNLDNRPTVAEGELSTEARDYHCAIEMFKEELDAVNRYERQLESCRDTHLQQILVRNQDEKKRQVKLIFEWLEVRDAVFSKELMKSLHLTKVPVNRSSKRRRA